MVMKILPKIWFFSLYFFFSKKFSNTIAITRHKNVLQKAQTLQKLQTPLYFYKIAKKQKTLRKSKKLCKKAKNFAKFAKKYKVQKNTLSGRGLFSSIFFSFIERRPSWRKSNEILVMSYFFAFFFGEYLVEIEKISNILRKKPFGGARRLSFRIIARAVCGIHKSQN